MATRDFELRVRSILSRISHEMIDESSLIANIVEEFDDLWEQPVVGMSEVASMRHKIEVVSHLVFDILRTQWKNADGSAYDAVREAVKAELYEKIAKRQKMLKNKNVKEHDKFIRLIKEKLFMELPFAPQATRLSKAAEIDQTADSSDGQGHQSILRAELGRPSAGPVIVADQVSIPAAHMPDISLQNSLYPEINTQFDVFNPSFNISALGVPNINDPGDLVSGNTLSKLTMPAPPSFLAESTGPRLVVPQTSRLQDKPVLQPGNLVPPPLADNRPESSAPNSVYRQPPPDVDESANLVPQLDNQSEIFYARPPDQLPALDIPNVVAPLPEQYIAIPPVAEEVNTVALSKTAAIPESIAVSLPGEQIPVQRASQSNGLPDSCDDVTKLLEPLSQNQLKRKRPPKNLKIDKEIEIADYAARAVEMNKRNQLSRSILDTTTALAKKLKTQMSVARLFSTPACLAVNHRGSKLTEKLYNRQLIVERSDVIDRRQKRSPPIVPAVATDPLPHEPEVTVAPSVLSEKISHTLDEIAAVAPSDLTSQISISLDEIAAAVAAPFVTPPVEPAPILPDEISSTHEVAQALRELGEIAHLLEQGMSQENLNVAAAVGDDRAVIPEPIAPSTEELPSIPAGLTNDLKADSQIIDSSVAAVTVIPPSPEPIANQTENQLRESENAENRIEIPVLMDTTMGPILPQLDESLQAFPMQRVAPEPADMATIMDIDAPRYDFQTVLDKIIAKFTEKTCITFNELLADDTSKRNKIFLTRTLLRLNSRWLIRLEEISGQLCVTKFSEDQMRSILEERL